MSPSHLSHNDLAEFAALPFESLPEHAAEHIAQCMHCADDYAVACEEHALARALLVVALEAGWQPQVAVPTPQPLPWASAVGLAAAIALALYTAPSWSVHLASVSLVHTARVFAGGARWFDHMADASPLFLLPIAGLALALSCSPQGDAHV